MTSSVLMAGIFIYETFPLKYACTTAHIVQTFFKLFKNKKVQENYKFFKNFQIVSRNFKIAQENYILSRKLQTVQENYKLYCFL